MLKTIIDLGKQLGKKIWRIISLQDIWQVATLTQKSQIVASVTVVNGVETTAKILLSMSLAKWFEMKETDEKSGNFLGYDVSMLNLLLLSSFFGLTVLTIPNMRKFILYNVEESFSKKLTEKLLSNSQSVAVLIPKTSIGPRLFGPLQKNLSLANSTAPEILRVTESIHPLFFNTVVGMSIAFSRFDPQVGLMLMSYIGIAIFTNEIVAYFTNMPERFNQTMLYFTDFTKNWIETLNNAEAVYLFNRAECEWQNAMSDYAKYHTMQKGNAQREQLSIIHRFSIFLLQVWAAFYVSKDSIQDVSDAVFFLSYAASMGMSMEGINRSIRSATQSIKCIDEINRPFYDLPSDSQKFVDIDLTDEVNESGDPNEDQPLLAVSSTRYDRKKSLTIMNERCLDGQVISDAIRSARIAVKFSKVSFRYVDPDHPNQPQPLILEDLNFEILAGQSTAIVGESSCGKTTIISLITGLISPTNSDALIKIGGININNIPREALKKIVCPTKQQPPIFSNRSVKYNVCYSFVSDRSLTGLRNNEENPLTPREAKILEEVVAKTKLGGIINREQSVGLSGGEQQRIAIAQIMALDLHIRILDESLSQLDSETARIILESINKDKKTTITIAHRLSTIRTADQILVMGKKDGKENSGTTVVESGCHEELIAKNGKYAKLWRAYLGDHHAPNEEPRPRNMTLN